MVRLFSHWIFYIFALYRVAWETCSRDSQQCPHYQATADLCQRTLAFLVFKVSITSNFLFRDFLLIFLFFLDIIYKCVDMQDMFGDTFKTDNAIHSHKIITLGKKKKKKLYIFFWYLQPESLLTDSGKEQYPQNVLLEWSSTSLSNVSKQSGFVCLFVCFLFDYTGQ